MRAQTLEIVWHKKEAIHALDILPFTEKNGHMRAATGGVDHMVRVWIIRKKENFKLRIFLLDFQAGNPNTLKVVNSHDYDCNSR